MDTSPFAGKAACYETYRADYPPEAIAAVVARAGLTGEQIVADLGSGTGLLTRHLLRHASLVHAVEPDTAMRQAAERALGREPGFQSVAGSAEETGLPERSIDVLTCGNSFHYFDVHRAAVETRRILRPGGRAVLLFHDAPDVPNAFMTNYLAFLRGWTVPALRSTHAPDDHLRRAALFLGADDLVTDRGIQQERVSEEILRGRFLSSSIAPRPGEPTYEPAVAALEALFVRHQEGGSVPYELAWTCLSGELDVR
jgi:SAM-dependent methyltransferase